MTICKKSDEDRQEPRMTWGGCRRNEFVLFILYPRGSAVRFVLVAIVGPAVFLPYLCSTVSICGYFLHTNLVLATGRAKFDSLPNLGCG
jgi:hypothetical protein